MFEKNFKSTNQGLLQEYLKPVKSMKVLSSRNAISQIFDAVSGEETNCESNEKIVCKPFIYLVSRPENWKQIPAIAIVLFEYLADHINKKNVTGNTSKTRGLIRGLPKRAEGRVRSFEEYQKNTVKLALSGHPV